jgi:hypothetical protein
MLHAPPEGCGLPPPLAARRAPPTDGAAWGSAWFSAAALKALSFERSCSDPGEAERHRQRAAWGIAVLFAGPQHPHPPPPVLTVHVSSLLPY